MTAGFRPGCVAAADSLESSWSASLRRKYVFGALGGHYFFFLFLRCGWTRWPLGSTAAAAGFGCLGVDLLAAQEGQGGQALGCRGARRAPWRPAIPGVGMRRITKNCCPMVQRLVVVQ